MRLNISAWSIRRPVPAIVLFSVLTLLGVISFMTMPVTRFPNIDIPLVSITVVQSGAAPAELETQVTKEVEDAVANITGVKHIVSTITDGQSMTVIEFRLTSEDTDHGFRIVGTDVNAEIPKRRRGETTARYTADTPGRFVIECSRPCGAGHTAMRAVLIVK